MDTPDVARIKEINRHIDEVERQARQIKAAWKMTNQERDFLENWLAYTVKALNGRKD